MERWDKIIIGAGLYGLYSALFAGQRGERVLVLEYEDAPFRRAGPHGLPLSALLLHRREVGRLL